MFYWVQHTQNIIIYHVTKLKLLWYFILFFSYLRPCVYFTPIAQLKSDSSLFKCSVPTCAYCLHFGQLSLGHLSKHRSYFINLLEAASFPNWPSKLESGSIISLSCSETLTSLWQTSLSLTFKVRYDLVPSHFLPYHLLLMSQNIVYAHGELLTAWYHLLHPHLSFFSLCCLPPWKMPFLLWVCWDCIHLKECLINFLFLSLSLL